MNTKLKLEKPWAEVKEKIKEIETKLTDEDLIYDEDDPDKLLATLAKKMDRTNDEIKMWIESVSANEGLAG